MFIGYGQKKLKDKEKMSHGNLFCGVEGSARFREPLPDGSFFLNEARGNIFYSEGNG